MAADLGSQGRNADRRAKVTQHARRLGRGTQRLEQRVDVHRSPVSRSRPELQTRSATRCGGSKTRRRVRQPPLRFSRASDARCCDVHARKKTFAANVLLQLVRLGPAPAEATNCRLLGLSRFLSRCPPSLPALAANERLRDCPRLTRLTRLTRDTSRSWAPNATCFFSAWARPALSSLDVWLARILHCASPPLSRARMSRRVASAWNALIGQDNPTVTTPGLSVIDRAPD